MLTLSFSISKLISIVYITIQKKELGELITLSLSNIYKKISSIVMLFVILIIITFSMFYITNSSYSLESPNLTHNDFNIIAVADVGCSIRAQENIKNIEKLDPEIFLVSGDLSYKKTPDCWFNMTKSLDSKTKIAIGNHDDYEEEGAKGEKLKQSFLNHYNLNKSYYSFDYQNVHVLVMDTQLEMSVDTLESTAIVNETTTTTTTDTKNLKEGKNESKKDKKEEPLLKRFPLVDLDDLSKIQIQIQIV